MSEWERGRAMDNVCAGERERLMIWERERRKVREKDGESGINGVKVEIAREREEDGERSGDSINFQKRFCKQNGNRNDNK